MVRFGRETVKIKMNLYSPLISLLVAYLLVNFLVTNEFVNKIRDIPNQRSLHNIPTPRIGGVGLIAGLLSGWTMLFNTLVWWMVLPLFGLFAVSLFDDIRNLSVKQRLLAHLLAATIVVVGSGLYAQQGVVMAAMLLLFIVWMINLYNFMDGSDGLAGGMAVIGFSIYAIGAWFSHNTALALLSLCVASAAAGFLYFNFHPAKIFMGDAGSISLGFLVAVIGLLGWQQGSWSMWFPLFVFSPFIADASITLIIRTLRGTKVTEAHREHYYQRVIRLGWGHRKVALFEYGVMLIAGISGLYVLNDLSPWQMWLAWGVVYASMFAAVDVCWNRSKRVKNV